MQHQRKIVLGGVSLTKTRINRHSSEAAEQFMNETEKVIIASDFLKEAPFKWISLIFYYGTKNDAIPKYKTINKKYKDLPVSIELDTNILYKSELNSLIKIYKNAVLKVLIDIGNKYNLPNDKVFLEYNKYS